MEPNNTRLQSFYSFRKNKDSAKCCILRIKKASTNYRSKLSLERWNFVGMRVNFKTLPPLSPWPDTKSILITILNKHDASLPAQMYCFFPLQLVSAPKKNGLISFLPKVRHSIFDLIGQYCFCSCWRCCKSVAKVIPLRLLHPGQSSLPSQLTPHASLSQHRTWYCLRAATTVIRILDL